MDSQYRRNRLRYIERMIDTLDLYLEHPALTVRQANTLYPKLFGARKAIVELVKQGLLVKDKQLDEELLPNGHYARHTWQYRLTDKYKAYALIRELLTEQIELEDH